MVSARIFTFCGFSTFGHPVTPWNIDDKRPSITLVPMPQCRNYGAVWALSCRGGHHVCRKLRPENLGAGCSEALSHWLNPDGCAVDTARFGSEEQCVGFRSRAAGQ
jgi:hypothetical protein